MTKNQIDLQIDEALDGGNDTFQRCSWQFEIRSVNFM